MEKKKLSLAEIKQAEVEILDYFVEVCNENNLSYYLDGGTLLGAVRHKGFIPWDDDIDVLMPRPDYEKLIRIMSSDHGRFKLVSSDTCMDYYYPYAKIIDTNTELIDEEASLLSYGLFIDIFPIDGLPADDKERKHFQDKIWKYRNIRWYSLKKLSCDEGISNLFKIMIGKLVGNRRAWNLLKKNVSKYNMYDSEYAYNIVESTRKYRNTHRRIFDEKIYLEFEGKKYAAPFGYDEYLTELYGDYMQLPPEAERVSNHSFIAYKKQR